jgi:hypothetical protein
VTGALESGCRLKKLGNDHSGLRSVVSILGHNCCRQMREQQSSTDRRSKFGLGLGRKWSFSMRSD